MAKNVLRQEISKQKWVIIITVVLISSIWGLVLFLEYKISQQKNIDSILKLETGLCLFLPKGCHAVNGTDHYSLYCQSGTAGKIFSSPKHLIKTDNSLETVYVEIIGANQTYFLELKISEDNDRQLGSVVDCPKD